MKRLIGLLVIIVLLAVGCSTEQGAVDPVMMDEPDGAVEIEGEDVPLSDGMVDEEGAVTDEGNGMVLLTLDELAAYNGMDGMPAYVAVDGWIYDVTDHPQWTTGEHGGNLAGTDITEMLKAAPHGISKLEEVSKIGKLIDGTVDAATQASDIQLSIEELAKYNGMDGMPAYVAVDGEIYDVTDHPQWATGEHGGNLAGTDITEMLKAAPHGIAKLEEVWRVGVLKDQIATMGSDKYDDDDKYEDDEDELELTLEELAKYNGKNGMPAYVAVDGKIYDVTNHPQWTTGEHGGNLAGTEITEMLKAAPHGVTKLEELKQVGELED